MRAVAIQPACQAQPDRRCSAANRAGISSSRSASAGAAAPRPGAAAATRHPLAAMAAAAQPQQPPADKPLPPYYQLSLPVYSLATVGPDGGSPTMNLVTYASPM